MPTTVREHNRRGRLNLGGVQAEASNIRIEQTPDLDLTAISTEIRQKMEWLSSVKSSKARNEGALAQVVEQLQNEHGVSTLEDATTLLERRKRLEARLTNKLMGQLERLRETEERIRNAADQNTDRPIPF